MESASYELALKPSLYNNRPIHSKYFRPGNTWDLGETYLTLEHVGGATHCHYCRRVRTRVLTAPISSPLRMLYKKGLVKICHMVNIPVHVHDKYSTKCI